MKILAAPVFRPLKMKSKVQKKFINFQKTNLRVIENILHFKVILSHLKTENIKNYFIKFIIFVIGTLERY